MTIDERMTICNMSIEGGARVGYVNPDDDDVRVPEGPAVRAARAAFDRAVAWWRQIASDADASYDDHVVTRRRDDRADRHLGHQPGAVGRHRRADCATTDEEALDLHGLQERRSRSTARRIDVAFIGSCTNGRLSDLEEAAKVVKGRRVAAHVKALVVPGSQAVRRAAEAKGLDEIFTRPASSGAAPAARCAWR